MPFKTLGELRSTLLARLGMGGMGASGGANLALIDSFLNDGQEQIYREQDWKHLQDCLQVTTGANQNLYDYPTAGTMDQDTGCADQKRILRIERQLSNCWAPLDEGITTEMWTTMDTPGLPQRFERYKQILIYPRADTAYQLRIWFVADLKRFTETSDRCTIDDQLVLLHATANAKAHYRQPDAEVYGKQLERVLAHVRGQAFTSDGVVLRGPEQVALAKPRVVGRDV